MNPVKNNVIDKEKFPETYFKVGSIIIAQPNQREPIFRRSVILITEYDGYGTRGIILNKLSNTYLDDMLDGLSPLPVNYGGPEGIEDVNCLHNLPHIEPFHTGTPCGRGIYYNAVSYTIQKFLKLKTRDVDFRRIKFYAGYVSWSPGELERQILQNKWWIGEINPVLLFSERQENLWIIKLQQHNHLLWQFAEVFDPSLS